MKYLILLSVICCTFGASTLSEWTMDSRITGGKPAEKGQFPYQVSVQYGYSVIFSHVCGGAIISSTWIVTAGNCITALPSEGSFKIVAGIIDLNYNGTDRQEIKVSKSYVHPQYAGGINPNDIALLQLSSPLQFNTLVKSISLPARDSVATGQSVLSGWGATSTTERPNQLQTADLPLLSYDECAHALINLLGSSKPLDKTNVCTGPLSGGVSACSGDSGSPLAKDDKLIGIVSWVISPCGTKGAPSVYTQVSNFIDFFEHYVKDLP